MQDYCMTILFQTSISARAKVLGGHLVSIVVTAAECLTYVQDLTYRNASTSLLVRHL